ncbi:MAG: homocysteine S-methyltransferase family protein [Flavobacteriales bacterium]|nr:homocysteine S-methyltransferase family protein [Flavobacteriales bacterium]
MQIQDILDEKILILDGAMGTMIQQYKFTEEDYQGERFKNWKINVKGNNDLLSITQPKAIEDIHFEYLEAGADILETNTFSSNRISMEDYGMQDLVYELNAESVKCARNAIEKYKSKYGEKPLFIAGSLGPTNKTASLSPQVNNPEYREVDFDFLASVYEEQAIALIESGADLLLVETIFDTLNAKAAFFGIENAFEKIGKKIPLMASGTITDASGRTLSGQTTEAFLISLSHVPLLSIGLNCALGAEQLTPYLKALANNSSFYVSVYPNAGLPNEMGEYDQSPEMMAKQVTPFLEQQMINIIGGCCGTTPKHIKAICETAKNYQPRKKKSRS